MRDDATEQYAAGVNPNEHHPDIAGFALGCGMGARFSETFALRRAPEGDG